MALIDKASLLMVPSVYEDGTLYNVLPSGNKAPDETGNHNAYDQTRADFTFSRGSNLAATRRNSSGLIEKGRENLLLQSNSFSTSPWDNQLGVGGSVTSGQLGYDGSNNAWLIEKNTTSFRRIQQSVSTSDVFTYSIYAKAGTTSIMNLRAVSASTERVEFDLSDGTIVFNQNEIDAKIEAVGTNGWYRCSITRNEAITMVQIYVEWNQTIGGKNIYIQDAQLEAGLVATPYIETGATTATAGVLENTPRIDYSSGAGALLLESQRTNLLPYSEYITGWTSKSAVYHTNGANATTSPEGISNGWKITGDGTTGQHYVLQTSSYTSGTSYTCSIYAKADTLNYVQLIMGAAAFGSTRYCNFDLSDGSIGSQGVDISNPFAESMGNGWYRIGFTCSAISTASGNFFPVLIESKTSSFFEVNSTTSSIFLYGGQVEAGSYVSSYVPTYGSAATRGADYMNTTPTDLLGSTTGSWFMEMNDMTFEVTGTSVPTIYLGDDVSNCLALEGRNSGNNKSVFLVKEESGTVTTLHAFTISGKTKFCFVWSGTTLKVFRDGTEEYSSTSFTQPTNWDLFVYNHTGREAFSEIANIQLYDTALSDSEAQTLTTL